MPQMLQITANKFKMRNKKDLIVEAYYSIQDYINDKNAFEGYSNKEVFD